ncbi:MucB/RseB-like sigma(E) regulatory protein [Sediminitomix flava]|uniref:MucB/RseB-like sigma(E) regulatory protein n=2 Tax=Sediminitomix flava TaxID=379075 RepID=A0A315ZGB7_SEDFL|nr:MucB/RseB-like sigma(E) regulatory protein [Sediminitomix flava]
MKYIILFLLSISSVMAQTPKAETILAKVDDNMFSQTKVSESTMIIYGKRRDRTMTSKSYSKGIDETYTEYLSPAREKGTKMLKLDDKLWIYTPSSDRTIQISGHMLRQSMMGSDVSYEDMMQEKELIELYNASVIASEEINGRTAWVLELIAKTEDVTYQKMKIWVDQEYYVPLKEDLFAKSGQLLKTISFGDVQKINGKYVPMKMNYKDVLKAGKGTDFIINKMEIDSNIPEHIFNKGNLKK